MNANAFRHFYDYHFAQNRKIWDAYVTALTPEQFTQTVNYAHGSVRNQIAHLINTDQGWFSALRGVDFAEPLTRGEVDDRDFMRTRWDAVERDMRDYLAELHDEMLFERPFPEGEDAVLILWQVLLHVANHGTDHRAQLLRLLSDLGIKTGPQDYVFYIFDHVM